MSAEYKPTSRRPIADTFRNTAHVAVRICVRWNVQPDLISYLSVVASTAAGLCFWQAKAYPILLLIGPIFCYARLWFNMLDGMVALASGKASLQGEIINELTDRISDVLIFVGIAHSGFNDLASGYWAAILALLVAYVGILGQAVGVQREFSGVMSKPWRMVLLHIGVWTTLGLLWWGKSRIQYVGLTVLDWICLLIIAGCLQTIMVRLVHIMNGLKEKAGRER